MEKFSKEDYQALSEIKKITKKSTLAEAYSKFYAYAEKIETENKEFKKKLLEARETILVQKTTISSQKIEIELLEQSIELLEAKNKANFGMNDKIKAELINKQELLLAISENLSADMSPNVILDVIQAIGDNTEDLEVYNDDNIQSVTESKRNR